MIFTLCIIFKSLLSTYNYSIGSTGPAGGIIFYVNQDTSASWKYLELDTDDKVSIYNYFYSSFWPNFKIKQADALKLNKEMKKKSNPQGMINTYNILYDINKEKLSYSKVAAYTCYKNQKEHNGKIYKDWFLPSKYEFELLFNAFLNINFDNGYIYWTSSFYKDNEAFTFDLSSGSAILKNIKANHLVKCIRAF